MKDMSNNQDIALDLQAFWFHARRFRALKKTGRLNAILLDDLAYEMRFILNSTKEKALRRAVSNLIDEMTGVEFGNASVGA